MTVAEQSILFNEWLSKHQTLIFKIVRAYGYTPMDHDDLFQEISIQVWRSIPSFRHESAVTTWIYRIALNTAISWIRKEQQYRHTSNSLEGVPDVLSRPPDHAADDQLAWLYSAIQSLDEIDRSVALLLLDGFSYKEMATILGITVSNVGVKINRIKKQLMLKSKKITDHGI